MKQMYKMQFRVLDSRKGQHGIEVDIEISKDKERGIAVLKIFGPNSKKECTLMITKSKKYEAMYVRLLAVEIIKPLIDLFISGEGWNNLFSKSSIRANKPFVCSVCNKGFATEKNLNTHIEKFHSGKNKSCDECDFHSDNEMNFKKHMADHNDSLKNQDTPVKREVNLEEESIRMDVDIEDVSEVEDRREELERIERSKMCDKKILEKEK